MVALLLSNTTYPEDESDNVRSIPLLTGWEKGRREGGREKGGSREGEDEDEEEEEDEEEKERERVDNQRQE